MTHLLLAVSLVASSWVFLQQSGGQRATDARNRDVYVTVLDADGKPATGLTAGDFVVREDGNQREVVRAGPATEQLTITVLVDDSQAAEPAIAFLRDGLNQFVDQLQGKAEIALVTFGDRTTSLVDHTTSTEQLKKGVGRIFARPSAGSQLLDAIVDVSRGLQKRETARPVIVALTVEGIEFSNRQYEQVLDEIRRSGATFHVLAIGSPSASTTDEMRNRNQVLAEGTSRTGGRRDQVLALSGIQPRLQSLAAELLNEYVVTYSRPDTLIPPERIEVSVTHPRLTVRAPKRLKGS